MSQSRMSKKIWKDVFHLKDLSKAASACWLQCTGAHVFAFSGPMGAGKTTFIRQLCRTIGVKDTVNSPTFSLVNEYQDEHGRPVYHMDLYRLSGSEEVLDAGMKELLQSGALCFIEWPERSGSFLPADTVWVYINPVDDSTREIEAHIPV